MARQLTLDDYEKIIKTYRKKEEYNIYRDEKILKSLGKNFYLIIENGQKIYLPKNKAGKEQYKILKDNNLIDLLQLAEPYMEVKNK